MSHVKLCRPWLEFDLGCKMRVLSWAVHNAGLVWARRILWREVRNADLPVDLDAEAWLTGQLRLRRATDAVTFLTSRDITFHSDTTHAVGDIEARAVATVGFSNAERIGQRIDRTGKDWGTINVGVRLNAGLSEPAQLEALSIAVQARTAAVMDAGLPLSDGAIATGTGTDCVAVACLPGDIRYAGLHTEIGEAVGGAVYAAVSEGATEWMATYGMAKVTTLEQVH